VRSRRSPALVLGHDGADLAAALQTIAEIGEAAALDAAIDRAFPGSTLEVTSESGRFSLRFRQHGLLRALDGAELSDGTLRYLLWVAALLTPRPPSLLVLNEPETSLHPDLLPALAGLIVWAAVRTQVVVVSHSQPLITAVAAEAATAGTRLVTTELVKEFGETHIVGLGRFEHPAWTWPKR